MHLLAIEILSDDLSETEKFYSDNLEFPVLYKDQQRISFAAGKSILTFIKSENLSPLYHFAFNIPHNKLDEALAWASSRFNLIKNQEHQIICNFESWNAQAFYFSDNNRNILEFIARFDLDNHSDQSFESASIECISEIGIVADTPLQFAEKLISNTSLNFFSKGARSEKFVTLGNDNGLFIIVATEREWYPTQEPAKKYYSKIRFSVDGLTHEIVSPDY